MTNPQFENESSFEPFYGHREEDLEHGTNFILKTLEETEDDYKDLFEDDRCIDFRVRIFEDEVTWFSGPVDFELDHRGSWGANSAFHGTSEEDVRNIAEEMLEEAFEHLSSCTDDEGLGLNDRWSD